MITAAVLGVFALLCILLIGGLTGDILAGVTGGGGLAAVHESANRASRATTMRGAAWRARRHRG